MLLSRPDGGIHVTGLHSMADAWVFAIGLEEVCETDQRRRKAPIGAVIRTAAPPRHREGAAAWSFVAQHFERAHARRPPCHKRCYQHADQRRGRDRKSVV